MNVTAKLKKLPPVVVTLGVAVGVVAVIAVARFGHIREVDARVVEERERARRARGETQTASEVVADPEERPAYKEAYRIQETTGAALGLTLVAVQARLATGAPIRNVGQLLEAATIRGLLPPGATVAGHGTVHCPYGVLYVRYRPDPVGIEVVSIPRTSIESEGAPLISRVTAESGAELYSLLREASTVEIPRPFETTAVLEAQRWKREPLREPQAEARAAEELRALAR